MTRDELNAFLDANHQAVMVSLGRDGRPHSVPMFCARVGDELWSSGTETRARTAHLRRDPRCAITVFQDGTWFHWVTVEGAATVRTDDPVEENLRVYKLITGKEPDDLDEYRRAMVDDRRLIYAVTIDRFYGPG